MAPNHYPEDDDDVEQQNLISSEEEIDEEDDGRTPLDKTIDRIGMGSYQWTLLSLCGCGWMADNMWIQAMAIILPRVQRHYDVPDNYIGSVSSSMFAGMMFGALGWGTCSDLLGRSAAFNATLFFTALFGVLASFANSFLTLCICLFLLGSAVGGSMPTDGTLLLEHMPKSKQYLVTALSVFFSFGSVLAAVVSLLVLPKNSCLPSQPCNVHLQNQGWRYLLVCLAVITLSMFLARIVFFRLHESPRYLVHAGRPLEAIESLQLISRFNGSNLSLEIDDVADHHPPADPTSPLVEPPDAEVPPRPTSATRFNATGSELDSDHVPSANPNSSENRSRLPLVTQYSSTHPSGVALDGYSLLSPTNSTYPPEDLPPAKQATSARKTRASSAPSSSSSRRNTPTRRLSSAGSVYVQKVCWRPPRWLRRPLRAWWERVIMVLSPEWRQTTLVMWVVWFSMSLAFTMFNVFLPKLLETAAAVAGVLEAAALAEPEGKSLEKSLWDVVIFTLGGCPGAILGAYLIESQLGRRWSLAGSTFITAVFCTVFALVQESWAVRASTVGVSLSATTMWAVLYGWTPEIFGTKVRGTACGIASALSRIGGMIAPMLGGALLTMDRTIPVYTSVVIFAIAGFCVLLVPERDEERQQKLKGERSVVH